METIPLGLPFNGPLKRDSLIPPHTLIQLFKDLRNTLAGRARGVTLDQTLVGQLIDVIACKVFDELHTPSNKIVTFQRIPKETEEQLYNKLCALFKKVRKDSELSDLFSNEKLSLEPELLTLVVEQLQPLELSNAKRDVIGEAFEVFIGPSIRGNEGQFFTPRNVVELACTVVNPRKGEFALDPACGTGGFLLHAIRRAPDNAPITVLGIDKDAFLSRITAIQLILMRGKHHARVVNADSLDTRSWPPVLAKNLSIETVDVIITNPPFGSKIGVAKDIIERFELGYQWRENKDSGRWVKTDTVPDNRPPQVLFIEHCLNLLKPGGRIVIVLPDGILGNESQGFIRQYIQDKADIVAIFDLPIETFLPSTSTKTSLLVLRKKNRIQQNEIFMAIPEKCGHDRRGKPIFDNAGNIDDDLPKVATSFRKWSSKHAPDF